MNQKEEGGEKKYVFLDKIIFFLNLPPRSPSSKFMCPVKIFFTLTGFSFIHTIKYKLVKKLPRAQGLGKNISPVIDQ